MHAKYIFTTLIVLGFFIGLSVDVKAKFQKTQDPNLAKDSVRSIVNKEIVKLKTDLNNKKSNKERFLLLSSSVKKINSVRKKFTRQSEVDENYMDLLMAALNHIPTEKSFKKEDCHSYKNALLFQLEPLSEEKPSEPGVKEGFEVLEILCK